MGDSAPYGTVAVVLELVVTIDRNGHAWTDSAFCYEDWRQFLEIFEGVRVVCRAVASTQPPRNCLRVDGPGVTVVALPHYKGLAELAKQTIPLNRVLLREALRSDHLLVRLPGPLGLMAASARLASGKRYSAYLVGDVHEVLAPGGPGGAARRPLRHVATSATKRAMRWAYSTSYVTASVLQERYPPRDRSFSNWFSDVEITRLDPRPIRQSDQRLSILSVGSMEQRYKRFDLVLQAFERVIREGIDAHLTIVGSGRFQREYQALAGSLGLTKRVTFTGQLAGAAAVRKVMRTSDLFVLASDTEGLPRVLIEAMSCGLPCIATAVGGTTELLHSEDLIPRGDERALSAALSKALSSPTLRQTMSARNLTNARPYLRAHQDERRMAFYRSVAGSTALRQR